MSGVLGRVEDRAFVSTAVLSGGCAMALRLTSFDYSEVEFWSGQPSRLHDRFRYTRKEGDEASAWQVDRLSP